MTAAQPTLGLTANWRQFSLLVLVNAFVGAMIGLERSVLPLLGAARFGLDSHTVILGFIAVFGVSKAAANYAAGRWSDRYGRKPVLVAGWVLALPIPFLLGGAQAWSWVLVANALLGVSQGLTWSTTVIMKIDLAGPARRGLAMGLNEFAGYLAVALLAWVTAEFAIGEGLQATILRLGIGIAVGGLLLSTLAVRETRAHAHAEAGAAAVRPPDGVFLHTSWKDRSLASVSQAGLVNNLNDGVAWGVFPLLFVASGLTLGQVGWLTALYPAVWGSAQLFTGPLSDWTGRKPLLIGGMALQAIALVAVASSSSVPAYATAMVALGLGTALVYPTFLAAVGDHAAPVWRAEAVGIYRLWRDAGYTVGALMAGVIADQLGLRAAVWASALATAMAAVALFRYQERR